MKSKGKDYNFNFKSIEAVDLLIDYESGELDTEERLELFARLIQTGLAWTLQGSYGRTAAAYIESGYISPNGVIMKQIA